MSVWREIECSYEVAPPRSDGWRRGHFCSDQVEVALRWLGGSAVRVNVRGCGARALGEVCPWRGASHGQLGSRDDPRIARAAAMQGRTGRRDGAQLTRRGFDRATARLRTSMHGLAINEPRVNKTDIMSLLTGLSGENGVRSQTKRSVSADVCVWHRLNPAMGAGVAPPTTHILFLQT